MLLFVMSTIAFALAALAALADMLAPYQKGIVLVTNADGKENLREYCQVTVTRVIAAGWRPALNHHFAWDLAPPTLADQKTLLHGMEDASAVVVRLWGRGPRVSKGAPKPLAPGVQSYWPLDLAVQHGERMGVPVLVRTNTKGKWAHKGVRVFHTDGALEKALESVPRRMGERSNIVRKVVPLALFAVGWGLQSASG